MTNAEDVPLTEDKPEADVAEQQIPVDLTVDEATIQVVASNLPPNKALRASLQKVTRS